MFKTFSKDQWLVLIGCCLFQCAMIGILFNCTGVLFAQIRTELGFTVSRISLYTTIKGLSTAFFATFITAYFFRSNKGRFLLLNQLALVVSYLLIIVGAQGPLWYVSAVINGVSFCLANIAVPLLLGHWFPTNSGTVTGIAMAFSGIGGAVCNPVCAWLIAAFNWQWTIVILGVVTMALTVPGLWLMLRRRPPQASQRPAAQTAARESGHRADRSRVVLVCLTLMSGFVAFGFTQNISIYAQSIGYSLAVGASLTTMVMIGNVVSKFVYGALCDKIGAWKATLLMLGAVALALVCFLFAQNQTGVLFAASLIYGCVYALNVVGISRCCISAYPAAAQNHYLGIHTSINNAIQAGSCLLVGVLYDSSQSFTSSLYLILAVTVCSMAAAGWLQFKTRPVSP